MCTATSTRAVSTSEELLALSMIGRGTLFSLIHSTDDVSTVYDSVQMIKPEV